MDSIQDCNTELTIGLTGHNSRPLRFSDQLPFAPKPLYSATGTLSHRNVAMDQGLVLFGQCISPLYSNDAGELNQNNSNTVSPPNSTISSFHESSHLKPGEAEVEKAGSSSRFTDEEEGGGTRKKLRLSQQQSVVLEESFKQNSTLNPSEKQALTGQLDLLPRQIEVWFQNRRARTKLKKTEQDCEKLRKYCFSLTEQNRKLQKELAELRALNFAATAPFYMEMARSKSVSLCPSCQRVVTPNDLPKLQLYPSH